jgi:hypothetical protein
LIRPDAQSAGNIDEHSMPAALQLERGGFEGNKARIAMLSVASASLALSDRLGVVHEYHQDCGRRHGRTRTSTCGKTNPGSKPLHKAPAMKNKT